ncbi:MAG: AMP-binding protein, partial [Mycobacteriales bacterium]
MADATLRSTMQDSQLTLSALLEHSRTVYASSTVVTFEGDGHREATYGEIGARSHRLAHALAALGVGTGDRVGTFLWNTQEHLEAYLAVPSMGAVLHTLNLRLFPEQLAYVINHAGDKVVVVDATVLPLLQKVAAELTTVERYVLVGQAPEEDLRALGKPVDRYEDLLAAAPAEPYPWPELDERAA